MSGSPGVSLCMIVKNEEDLLRRCLDSVSDLVDEIILVDTGSQDGTKDIGRSFQARIIEYPWGDDFAAARNVSLEAATKEWIFVLDADDELRPGQGDRFRDFLMDREIEGYLFETRSFVGQATHLEVVLSPFLRLFRNRSHYRYVGAIHEHLDGIPIERLTYRDVVIHHYGYLHEHVVRKNKVQRNLNILLRLRAQNPGDPFTLFNLGTEFVRASRWEEAVEVYQEALKLAKEQNGWVPELYRKLVTSLMVCHRFDEAHSVLQEGIEVYPDYTDLTYLEATLFHQTGHLSKALTGFARCLDLGESPPYYVTDQGSGGFRARLGQGLVYTELGLREKALTAFGLALRDNPEYYAVFRPMVQCVGRNEALSPVVAQYAPHVMESSESRYQMGVACLEEGRLNDARTYFAGSEPRMVLMQAVTWGRDGYFRKARRLLEPLPLDDDPNHLIAFYRTLVQLRTRSVRDQWDKFLNSLGGQETEDAQRWTVRTLDELLAWGKTRLAREFLDGCQDNSQLWRELSTVCMVRGFSRWIPARILGSLDGRTRALVDESLGRWPQAAVEHRRELHRYQWQHAEYGRLSRSLARQAWDILHLNGLTERTDA